VADLGVSAPLGPRQAELRRGERRTHRLAAPRRRARRHRARTRVGLAGGGVRFRHAAPLFALALACNGKQNATDAATPKSATATPSDEDSAEVVPVSSTDYAANVKSDDHLLLSAERLAEAKRRADAGDAAWKALKENVDAHMGTPTG